MWAQKQLLVQEWLAYEIVLTDISLSIIVGVSETARVHELF
jgi:hypothetical protein